MAFKSSVISPRRFLKASSFLQQVYSEFLLCTWHSFGCWGYKYELDSPPNLALKFSYDLDSAYLSASHTHRSVFITP